MNVEGQSESPLAKASQELAAIEKRDWALWLIVAASGVFIGVGLTAIAFPTIIIEGGNVEIGVGTTRGVCVALVGSLCALDIYLIARRRTLNRSRESVISAAIQNQVTQLQSFQDPLTEVYNRRSLEELAAKFISRAKRLGKPLTFMLVDVDRFQEINDRFGPLTGNFVLAEAAALLRTDVRGSDAVIRCGGDEFLLVLADASAEGGRVVKTRVAKSVDDWNGAGRLPKFRLSLNTALAEWNAERTLDDVLNEAKGTLAILKQAREDPNPKAS